MLGLELDPLRAGKRALRTEKGVAWPPLTTINQSINFYIFEIHVVFNKIQRVPSKSARSVFQAQLSLIKASINSSPVELLRKCFPSYVC